MRAWTVIGAGALALSCGASGPEAVRDGASRDEPPAASVDRRPLAEAKVPGGASMLQVTDVRRAGAEVLDVAFALVPIAPPASPASVPSPVSTPPAAGLPVPGSEEWLAASYLLDEERGTRFYLMRDAAGRPRCSPAPPAAAGARREMSARFPAPGGTRVTIVVPGVPPFRGIAVPGTPAPGSSY